LPKLEQQAETSTVTNDLVDSWYGLTDRHRRKRLWWWFPAPCKPCLQGKNLRRFHLTCLTCPDRRFIHKKFGSEKFTQYKKVIMVMESASGKPFTFPKRYRIYGLVIPTNPDGSVNGILKSYLLKVLITIAERIAEA
jgi:hypothetical protein